MKRFEHLEATLRGFRPHPPSPRVKAALFAPQRTPAPAEELPPPSTGVVRVWFAPLAAAAVLLLSLATAWSPGAVADTSTLTLAARPDAWEASLVQVQRNAPPQPSFRSTTKGTLASSFGSLLLRQTNALVR